jgi:hypothetical protein
LYPYSSAYRSEEKRTSEAEAVSRHGIYGTGKPVPFV